MIFRKRRTQEIGRDARGSRRRRLANIISRSPRVESLEARHLLTAYLVDVATDNAADASGVADGVLSLREAIIAANTNADFGDATAGSDDGDSITFDSALAGAVITLGNGQFTITDDLTIDGSAGGASRITVDADDLSRVFEIATTGAAGTSSDVSLSNLITTNGNAQTGFGGGINVSSSPLSLTNVDITSSTASDGGGLNADTSSVTISGGSISNNSATPGGFGAGEGGGISVFLGSTVQIDSGTTIANNSAVRGGGIHVSINDSITLSGVSISGNTASNDGGGIYVDEFAGSRGTANLSGATTILGNTANNDGGGIANNGNLNVNGAVIGEAGSGNSAGGNGGGIFLDARSGTNSIANVTMEANTASGNAPNNGGGALFIGNGKSLSLGATVTIANNAADGASGSGGGIFLDTAAALIANGTTITGNVANRAGGGIEDNSGAGQGVTLTNVTLRNNVAGPSGSASPGNGGGIHVTGSGGVSISGGTISGNTAASEGGGLWNGGGTMTISGASITGNKASGDAAEEGGGGIFNNGGALNIATSTIANNTADGGSGSGGGILNDVGGTVVVTGSTISGNIANRAGGGIEDASGAGLGITLNNVALSDNVAGPSGSASPGNGGGLHVTGAGEVSILNGSFTGNSAAREGGGLWNSSGTMTITGTTIDGNSASGDAADDGGGGVFNNGGIVNISSTTISNNVADGAAGSGGGILNLGGSLSIATSVIDSNSANRAGGGIEDNAGVMSTVTDSTIQGNDAGNSPGNGGGVHITGAGNVAIETSTIAGNTANEGGGLWNSSTGTFTVTNSTISGNTAGGSDGGGLFNTSGGTVSIDSATITLNSASTGIGSGIAGGAAGVTLTNTIVAQNPGMGTEENVSGSIASDDFNLIGDADTGVLTGATINTIFAADALLLPLANNGGPTATHLPASGSPAIGFGSTVLATDQRGEDRPQGSEDDIGAVEVKLSGIVVDAGSGVGDGLNDEFLIMNDDQGITGDILVYVNSQLRYSLPKATTGQILVRGSSDDDTLTVDNSNGLIGATIIFDGDGSSQVPNAEVPVAPGGLDLLRLVGSTPTTTTYNPGATVDAGAVYQEQDEVVQRVQFFGLEPIQVVGTGGGDTLNVASTPLGIGFPQALNADNAINYSEGPNSNDPLDPVFAGDVTGLVTVDGFESLEFSGFGTLNIDAGAGSDVINLNNPVTPTDLTTINVDGGDPTAESDTVIVNGTTASDAITVDQLTIDGATVTGAQPVEVNITKAESLVIHGQGGNDQFTLTADDSDEVEYTPDVYEDAGSFIISSDSFGPTQRLLPLSFRDLGAGGQIAVDSESGNRNLDFRYFGTENGDRFDVDASGRVRLRKGDSGFLVSLPIDVNGASELFIESGGGDDQFDVDGNHPFSSGVKLRGGSPGSGSDVLRFAGSGTGAVTLDLSSNRITEVGFGGVTYAEIESVNLTANEDLTVNGTNQSDLIDVTPTGAGNDGNLVHDGSSATFRYTNATSITINGAGGIADQINVHGNDVANTVTSTADSITVDGSTVTLGDGLESLQLLAGSGDDDVNLSALVFEGGITILGGDGNDTLVGSPQADHLFGGSGNDILIGGGGDDFQYGEDGDDIFGNPTLTADGTADDPGADQNFGGDGTDNFVWEPGDGTDSNHGGDDGADVFRFFGRDAADTFTLRSGGAGSQFDAVFNTAVIENSGIEDILVDPLGENDTVVVEDLFSTEISSITISAAGGDESITVAGRATADELAVGAPLDTRIEVRGLTYDINVLGPNVDDSLTINVGDGNDSIHVAEGVEAILNTSLLGGAGNDSLSGNFNSADGGADDDVLHGGSTDSTITGGEGNDSIIGGVGNETIDGGAGEDSIIGGGGNDTIDGGGDFDTILIEGTSGADVIDVFQASPTELRHSVNGDAQVDTLVAETVEEARILAGAGADLIRVNWLDAHGINAADDALQMTVEGGSDSTGDRLVVVDDGDDDLVLFRKGQTDDSGSVQVGPGNAEPLLSVFTGIETINFVDEAGAPIVNDPNGPQLVVFKHDPFETNDDRFTATYLGGGATINVDPTIDPGPLTDPFGDGFDLPGDRDYYRLVAAKTGTLDFQVYFRQVGELASGRPGLPGDGNLDIRVLDSEGNAINGFGTNDDNDDERVRIPAVAGQTYYLEVIGSADAVNVYSLSFVNEAPPVPYALELDDNPINGQTNPPGTQTDTSDTGRSQFDNHTYDDTPTIYFRLDDGIFLHDLPGNAANGTPPDEVIAIPFQAGVAQPVAPGYAIAIFDEGNTPPQTGTAPQEPLGFASAVAGQEGVYVFTVPDDFALSEGSHFLTARVQMIDPAVAQQTGFGGRSLPLEIVVDRTPPEVVFGLASVDGDGLHPDSNSGDLFLPETLTDSITNDLTPTLFGRAEANSIVRAYLDLDDSGDLSEDDLLIGQTVATPYDGTEQLETPFLPDEPGGQWELTATVSMNDPLIVDALGRDGLRRIFVTAEDVAGNISDETTEILELFIDTQGPQVDGVFITGEEDFNLFALKPETPEPTPRVDSLTIRVVDLPERIEPFFYSAISNVPPLAPIVLVGDHSGVIAIDSIEYIDVNSGPGIAVGEIVLTFDEPLPDDRYTLTLSDNIIDPAGNHLDGENDAAEPIGDPFFPTGDLIPGGDFIARFTVDSRPEIATWSQGVVYADINGNLVWDPEGQDNDATNRDFVFNFGEITDAYFTGNFAKHASPGVDRIIGTIDDIPIDPEDVVSSGFDKLGAYGAFNGQYQFFLDTDDDGVGDLVGAMAFQVNAIPVAGNFFMSYEDENAIADGRRPRDEIGAFDGQNWYLDVNGNNQIDSNERFATSLRGIPVVGDFNGDGFDDLATYNNATGLFHFDLNRDGTADDQLFFGFSGFGERPVSGDVNLDGVDDLVMWVPHREGQLPKDAGEFHFLVSDRSPVDPEPLVLTETETLVLPSELFDPYSPAPLGNDLVAQFGDDFSLPLFGNFDPPVDGGNSGTSLLGSLSNEFNPLDTTGDGKVTARDALVVINALGRVDFSPQANPLRAVASLGGYRLDASQDGRITSLDALRVINALGQEQLATETESAGPIASGWASLADQAIADLDEEGDELLDLLASDSSRIF